MCAYFRLWFITATFNLYSLCLDKIKYHKYLRIYIINKILKTY